MLDDRSRSGVIFCLVLDARPRNGFAWRSPGLLAVCRQTSSERAPIRNRAFHSPMTEGHDMHISADRQDLRRARHGRGDDAYS